MRCMTTLQKAKEVRREESTVGLVEVEELVKGGLVEVEVLEEEDNAL